MTDKAEDSRSKSVKSPDGDASSANTSANSPLPPTPVKTSSASTVKTSPNIYRSKSYTSSDSQSLLESDAKIKSLLNSDSALDMLSERLKQSLSTAEEYSKFIKKKAQIEDEHYNQLKKFAGHIRLQMKNSSRNLKKDSLQFQMDKIIEFDENLFGVGSSYVTALNTMYDELTSLINTITRSRKTIKDEYRRKDRECIDAIAAAEKAKVRYNHLCEDLEKLKNSDPSKKSFSLKSKTVEQQEDDLQRKVDAADQDYKAKVATCKKLKDEILVIHRPNNAKKLKNLILEMDIALNVQLQKYATWNETLIMNSGVLISPLQSTKPSMKAMASSVDNERDLYEYIVKHGSQVSNKSLSPIDYNIHPSLIKASNIGKPFLNNNNHNNINNNTNNINFNNNNNNNNINNNSTSFNNYSNVNPSRVSNSTSNIKAAVSANPDRVKSPSVVNTSSSSSVPYVGSVVPRANLCDDARNKSDSSKSASVESPYSAPTYSSLDPGSQPGTPNLNGPKPLNSITTYKQPTFGVSIEEVITFAGIDNVPLIVRKCIEVVESFGIDVVGIYRTSSNLSQVTKLKDSIDSNFTNYLQIGKNIDPNNVLDADIFCIASLLKLYLASLPEPLVTSAEAKSFIETVKLNDEHLIAKKLHHLVYNLPDGAYFTLRALIFHLNKIAAHESQNRMNAKSLAIIWGPVVFNDKTSSAQDLSYKTKVVEELMSIANDIFELDE
ncbi:uncharacterized protein LODBEIA_P24510 [Lodderomyces beijingensis]|uniref:RhoGAP-domain-containing protein n=1 Tax=Lodderomyces beijingensis TaxID=1775926 RepID=A0ABP0ZLH8_9ASCO